MNTWFVVALAAFAANLPFLNHRLLGVIAIDRWSLNKPFRVRLAEWGCFYFLVGSVALTIEASQSNAFVQRWEFFAITVCLFLVLAFPGFVARYLIRHRSSF